MTSYLEQLNEYYKLKKNYEESIENQKNIILYGQQYKKLSIREKRYEYQKIKHKCINCKRPVGSVFSVKYDNENMTRVLTAKCGDKVNPCPFNIIIQLGYFENYSIVIKEIEDLIKHDKNQIIIETTEI